MMVRVQTVSPDDPEPEATDALGVGERPDKRQEHGNGWHLRHFKASRHP